MINFNYLKINTNILLQNDGLISSLKKLLNTPDKFIRPNYTSGFVFELRKDSAKNYYVKLFYKDNKANEPISFKPVSINGCAHLCPLPTFLKSTKKVLNLDLKSLCRSKIRNATIARRILNF